MPGGDLALALHDRQTGVMPSEVQRHPEGDELWAAFRRAIGASAWTGTHVRMFVAGWSARGSLHDAERWREAVR